MTVDFFIKYKHYVDLNMKFGLILVDVNLRHVLQQQRVDLSKNVRSRLEELFVKNDEVSKYFQLMVQRHQNNLQIAQNIKLVQLFYNVTTWPRPPDKFNLNLMKQTNFYSPEQLENIYGKWQKYHKNVDNYDELKPSPAESVCLISSHCEQLMLGGNEFGYGLTHSIQDKSKTDMFCQKCFNKVKYIASNGFKLPDLMFGQITLCSILGHAQFLRNDWIKSSLQFQTMKGCFSEKITTGHFDENQMRDYKDDSWKISGVVADDAYKEIIQDLPEASDFDRYLTALEMMLDFCIRHKHYVDLNLQFGLFLIDVNLRQALQQKRTSIPATIRSRLEKLFVKNDVVTNYFHLMLQNVEHVPKLKQSLKLSRLFYDATTWSKPVEKFNLDLLNKTTIKTPEQLKKIYGRWDNYYKNVYNYLNDKPTPVESDKCIAYMVHSTSRRLNRRSQPNCLTPPRCKAMLEKGSDFGYGLTHRLLYLIIARFSQRCIVFSEKEDKLRSDMECKNCFTEAEFIALNSFQMPDLLYEHIALCGIFGHAQFLRNYWLKTLLHFQISEGCFSPKIATGEFDESLVREDENKVWQIERSSNMMNGQCDGHFTAVAAATLSHALRYIIETQY